MKNISTADTLELVQATKDGNLEAFEELIRRNSSKLVNVSFGLLGNTQDAEEVVQDSFLRALNGLDSFRGESSFETWIYRIVVNLSRNKYQWKKRRGGGLHISLTGESFDDFEEVEEILIPDESLTPELLIGMKEYEKKIVGIFLKLPEKLREVMILRNIHELSYVKIAERAKCKVGTVKSRISRAREMLREQL